MWKTQWGLAVDRMKMYGRGTDDESAVGSIQLQELLCQCGSRPLSHYRFHIQATACPRVLCGSKLLPGGGKMKRQRERQRQKEADSSVVEVYCEGMDLARLKCHSVNMGFCLVPGHDRDNASPPPRRLFLQSCC